MFHEGKQPTCSEGGWKDYVTCESCDYTTYEALGATGEHTYDAYGKCIYCKTSKAPAVYDPETATIVLHEVPEGTEKILISAYSEMGQLVGTAAGAVGVEIYLPFGESAYRICVYCFDSLWRPVGQSYILFP